MKRVAVFSIALAACHGHGKGGFVPDADVDPDGGQPLAAHRFVMSKQKIPSTTQQAKDFAFDLDGNGSIDNQLGGVMASTAAQGFNVQTPADIAVDRGQILMLAEVRADSLDISAFATFQMFTGTNPNPAACSGPSDQVCRKHLTGSASFIVSPATSHDPPLSGAIGASMLVAGPGRLQLQTTILGATPVALDLIGARVKLRMTTSNTYDGSVGGAVKKTDVETKVFPRIQAAGNEVIQRDCTSLVSPPGCGCAPSSAGQSFVQLFDSSKNCNISIDEIKNNTLIQSMFMPDVTIDGQQAVSIGVGITGVKATFTP